MNIKSNKQNQNNKICKHTVFLVFPLVYFIGLLEKRNRINDATCHYKHAAHNLTYNCSIFPAKIISVVVILTFHITKKSSEVK